ncbi:MAG: hypothetical protein KJ721_00115 [Nanoarchaeota archaeon]|nr:hypothetical protein [Nanoarchaeota archaeon]
MGLFNKKKKEDVKKVAPELPRLPELPKLPKLPGFEDRTNFPRPPISQLPSFPISSLGEKFSQNNIKEAVTGKREGGDSFDADDFDEDEMKIIPDPLKKQLTQEISLSKKKDIPIPREFEEAARKVKSAEPVFIRIDKFEESLKIFNQTREKILKIEGMLKKIREVNEAEEKELEIWENEVKNMKVQIERVDKDIFSKIE